MLEKLKEEVMTIKQHRAREKISLFSEEEDESNSGEHKDI